eukprot:TRINITY_DN897_c1_g1_i1.p1 TRINITY_DN897_c1_g1~~TRINITY_DN897_c1_g1_i1.p1  ORF type:complete len:246 (+),score=142.12 TRINITY_DN897_c1_g1_i1:161-898(+)
MFVRLITPRSSTSKLLTNLSKRRGATISLNTSFRKINALPIPIFAVQQKAFFSQKGGHKVKKSLSLSELVQNEIANINSNSGVEDALTGTWEISMNEADFVLTRTVESLTAKVTFNPLNLFPEEQQQQQQQQEEDDEEQSDSSQQTALEIEISIKKDSYEHELNLSASVGHDGILYIETMSYPDFASSLSFVEFGESLQLELYKQIGSIGIDDSFGSAVLQFAQQEKQRKMTEGLSRIVEIFKND